MDTKDIPGPSGWWFLGNVFQMDPEYFHNTLLKWKEEFGSIFQFRIFRKNVIVISDLDLMKKAFDIEDLCHRPDNFANILMYNGSGVVSANFSEQQRVLKKIVWDVLADTRGDLQLEILFDMELLDFVDSLNIGPEIDVNLNDYVTRSIAKQMASDFIGVRTTAVHSKAVVMFLDATNELYRRGRELILTMCPWLRYIPGPLRRVVNDLYEKQTALVEMFMEEARNTHVEDGEHSILHRLFVKQKAENEARGENYITDENIYSCILELLMASVIPISQNIQFAILSAIFHPEMQEKIHDEIEMAGPVHDVSVDKLHFFRAFVLESFRYVTMVIITVPRYVSKETIVDGYTFKEHSLLLGSLFNLHHDEKIFDDPWKFRPERFLDDDGKLLSATSEPMKSLYIFGFGFRDCKAQDQSMEKVYKYLMHLFYIYKIKPPLDSELPSFDPRNYNTVTVMNVPQIYCRFERRV